jgi:predicted nucleic acid-binding protein
MIPVFLDANIFIYTIGQPHPLKPPSAHVIELVGRNPASFVTSAEVFQEVLHRAISLRIWDHVRPGFLEFLVLMNGRIESLEPRDVSNAATLADFYPRLSARDLVHLAVMQRLGCDRIVTADSGFDDVDGIERLDPANAAEWRALIETA